MKLKVIFSAIILIVFCLSSIESSNILGVFTSTSKSHVIVHMAVVDELLKKGHNVTVITTVPITQSNPRLRHIKLQHTDYHDIMKKIINTNSTWTHFTRFFGSIGELIKSGDTALKDPNMLKFLNEKDNKFDLLLLGYFLNDYQIGLGAHFQIPIALIWSGQPFGIINEYFGNPSEISHVPHVLLHVKNRKAMTFFERVFNFLSWFVEQSVMPLMKRQMRWYYEDNFPLSKYPSFEETQKNISLLLCNHHFTEGPVKAAVPAIVEIGGIQTKPKPDPLPKDINEFLESASKDGAIYFSLGSNVQSAFLPPDTIEIIYKVLSSLKQKVLWKWEDDVKPGNSPNIFFSKWLPQDDVLAHPNVRLFITHGGKGSVVEAKYHAVPMVGIPIFADQPMNTQLMEGEGFGIALDMKILTFDILRKAILEVLENPKYRNNIKKYSNLYRDRPMTARETATYWIEYVIRNNGAYHLQSPAIQQSKIEYLGLDVAAFLIIILYVIWKIDIFILKFLWRKITCQKKAKALGKGTETKTKKKKM